jgi:hypothetical protein
LPIDVLQSLADVLSAVANERACGDDVVHEPEAVLSVDLDRGGEFAPLD